MICIIKTNRNEIVDWLIANDVNEARWVAQAAGHIDLAAALYRVPFPPPPPGKYPLMPGYTMLVS